MSLLGALIEAVPFVQCDGLVQSDAESFVKRYRVRHGVRPV